MIATLHIFINGRRRLSCPYSNAELATHVIQEMWPALTAGGANRVALVAEGADRIPAIIANRTLPEHAS